MSYFKILRWIGGEGGDTLLNAILLSHPDLVSNVIASHDKLGNVRTLLNFNDQLPENIVMMSQCPSKVNVDALLLEIEKLRLSNIPMILKSHLVTESLPYSVNLIASPYTLDFFFSARIKKLGIEILAFNENDYRLIEEDQNLLIKNAKKSTLNRLRILMKEKNNLLIDDLLTRNYDKIEQVLEIKIKDIGRDFINAWTESQIKAFPEELARFRQ
jgi:hypothetical protein